MPKNLQLRSFQRLFLKKVHDILEGHEPLHDIFCAVTPGAGKSALPLILSRLIPKIADKICWVVPREALSYQGEQVCLKDDLQKLFPHTARFRKANNIQNPSGGLTGYVITYQSIESDPDIHRQEFERYRYILFLDEPHHIRTSLEHPEDPSLIWKRKIQPLVDLAVLRVFASGTLERGDKKPIAFLPYGPYENGRASLVLPEDHTIRYSRREAIREKAIVPLYFEVKDAKASWANSKGIPFNLETFDDANAATNGPALNTVLKTDFAYQMLDETIAHWRAHKAEHFPPAKLLIVAPYIPQAKQYTSWLKKERHIETRIAISEESAEAKEAIDAFKGRTSPSTDILVTVAMAYEGLDVPEITHVAFLTSYRTKPWLEQCFARACRTYNKDGYEKHAGYIFAPDDRALAAVIEAIKVEQVSPVHEEAEQEGQTGKGSGGGPPEPIIPLSSIATASRAYDLSYGITREETAKLALIMQRHKIKGLNPLEFKQANDAYNAMATAPTLPASPSILLTPSEEEDRYRRAIDVHTKQVDWEYFSGEFGRTNGEILRHGWKNRDVLSLEELHNLWTYIQATWPLSQINGNPLAREA